MYLLFLTTTTNNFIQDCGNTIVTGAGDVGTSANGGCDTASPETYHSTASDSGIGLRRKSTRIMRRRKSTQCLLTRCSRSSYSRRRLGFARLLQVIEYFSTFLFWLTWRISDDSSARSLPVRQYVDGGMTVEKCTAKCSTLSTLQISRCDEVIRFYDQISNTLVLNTET